MSIKREQKNKEKMDKSERTDIHLFLFFVAAICILLAGAFIFHHAYMLGHQKNDEALKPHSIKAIYKEKRCFT